MQRGSGRVVDNPAPAVGDHASGEGSAHAVRADRVDGQGVDPALGIASGDGFQRAEDSSGVDEDVRGAELVFYCTFGRFGSDSGADIGCNRDSGAALFSDEISSVLELICATGD